jgi:cobalt/nickel transport system permease protein
MSSIQKKLIGFAAALALMPLLVQGASAMHIMEGYLPPAHSIAWGAAALPFIIAGFFSLRKKLADNRRAMVLLAISGAFVFVISALKIPSVTGSCSHMTGTGLGAILFGPLVTSVLGLIVLVFQAVLLAHGGLTTLGANAFSMAIAGPFLTFGVYILCKKLKANNKVNVFIAVASGSMLTYCITAAQLAFAHPSADGGVVESLVKFLAIFAVTQIPLSVIEGLLSVLIISVIEMYAKEELAALNYKAAKGLKPIKGTVIACTLAVIIIALVPIMVLSDADFEGADGAASGMVGEIFEEIHAEEFEPWAEPLIEMFLGDELPGEIESLLFCLQTGIGVGVIAFSFGKLNERRKKEEKGEAV